ncbi:YbaB/EbfC family nucleoid-associated protein [Nocardia tengchongensis]|uniref:YbaB/EbfC family nucleoid-associated protein n=1 Tax=Nocardia tengchongensis TaxID=2055889 RepID=UPI0036C4541C
MSQNHALHAVIAQVGDQLEALTLAADGLTRVAGRASDPAGMITATVAGDGTLAGLTLAESITAYPPEQAAAAILATIAEATAAAAAQRAALLTRLGGGLT